MVVIKLSNGLKVANFSSPHPFTFVDGTILPAVPAEQAEKFKVTFKEISVLCDDDHTYTLKFELSDVLIQEINRVFKEWDKGLVDVVLCPLPMLQAMKEHLTHEELTHDLIVKELVDSPFRCIRMEDRIEKKCSINKFTI